MLREEFPDARGRPEVESKILQSYLNAKSMTTGEDI
jgi:hypothetical protein